MLHKKTMGWGINKTMREMVLADCHTLKKDFKQSAAKCSKGSKKSKVLSLTSASAREIIKHATDAIPALYSSKGGGSAKPMASKVSTVQSTLKPTSKNVYPPSDHWSILDAAAAFRRLAFKGCSAVQAATSVLKLANTSNALNIVVMFDLGTSESFPPQRAELHKRRYAGKSLAYDDAVDIFRLLRCSKEDLPKYPLTRPLLTRSDLDWNLLFMDKELKLFTFNVFATALQHAASTLFESGALLPDASVVVWGPNQSCTTITKKALKREARPVKDLPLYCAFGEGDLRCYGKVLSSLFKAKKSVVVHSIDTDFLLMTLAANAWMPALAEGQQFHIVLSESVYNGNGLLRLFNPVNESDKLNTAFWAMGFGTDYCNPLTTNGYFNNDVKKLLYPKGHCRKPITILSDTEARFSLTQALLALKPFKCNAKKCLKDCLQTTLLKMLFCLQYYGLMFVSSKTPDTLFPPACVLDSTDSLTFRYKPNAKVLGCE